MTADVLPFVRPGQCRSPNPQSSGPQSSGRRRLAPGDMVVACFNASMGLWCAWPVQGVDDDGVVVSVRARGGQVLAVERVTCGSDVYGLAAADHPGAAFEALRWATWPDALAALEAFAAIARLQTPRPPGVA